MLVKARVPRGSVSCYMHGRNITRSQYYPYTKMPCDVEDERRMDWTCPGFVPRVVFQKKN